MLWLMVAGRRESSRELALLQVELGAMDARKIKSTDFAALIRTGISLEKEKVGHHPLLDETLARLEANNGKLGL